MCSCNIIQNLANIQNDLSKKIIEEDCIKDIEYIAGVDVSFSKNNIAVAAAVVIDFNTVQVIEEKTAEVEFLFPYISGFLGFRESDAMISVLKTLNNKFDVLMVNGHGTMHPRGFGLASHVGLLMDLPTIGIAKRLTGRNYRKFGNSLEIIKSNDKPLGACDKNICISIGHKISLNTAIEVIKMISVFKMPEPMRKAHILATRAMKNKCIYHI